MVNEDHFSSSTGFHFLGADDPTDRIRKVNYKSEANKTAAFLQRFFNFSGFPDFLIRRTFEGEDLFQLIPVNYELLRYLHEKDISAGKMFSGIFLNNRGVYQSTGQFILETKKVVKYIEGASATYKEDLALSELEKGKNKSAHKHLQHFISSPIVDSVKRYVKGEDYVYSAEDLLHECSEFFRLRERKLKKEAEIEKREFHFANSYGKRDKIPDFFLQVIKDDRKFVPENEKSELFALYPLSLDLIKFESKLGLEQDQYCLTEVENIHHTNALVEPILLILGIMII
tara:strand:- start:121 stop:978 length:858 start_codon:yes stop_codon:yes gene_type:complete